MIDVDKNKLLARCARRQAMAMSQQVQRVRCAALLSQSHVGSAGFVFDSSIDATKNRFQKRNRAYSENFRRVTVTLFWVCRVLGMELSKFFLLRRTSSSSEITLRSSLTSHPQVSAAAASKIDLWNNPFYRN